MLAAWGRDCCPCVCFSCAKAWHPGDGREGQMGDCLRVPDTMAFVALDSCFRKNDGVGYGILLGALKRGCV